MTAPADLAARLSAAVLSAELERSAAHGVLDELERTSPLACHRVNRATLAGWRDEVEHVFLGRLEAAERDLLGCAVVYPRRRTDPASYRPVRERR